MGFPKTITLLFLTMALLGARTMATEYIVGDDAGWTTGVDYQAWASKYTFRQGDTLRFVYHGDHDVEQLFSPEEFARCMSGSAGILYPPDASVPLNDVGTYYFICGFPYMCKNGMKLQVTVLPAGQGGTQTPTGPQTPPSPTTNVDPRTVVSVRPHGAASSLCLSAWVNIALLIFTTSCGLFLQL